MADALPQGTVIASRYRVERVLGEGGAGTTYLVGDELRGGELALKVLHAEDRIEAAEELRLLRGLSHPNLARMRDFGRLTDGRLFYTADYVAGVQLAGLKGWEPVARALVGALEALRWLHAVGIRHGDVKADNVLVRGDEGVLIDLSCAARFGVTPTVSGTPGYIAPELLAGQQADGHADRYAVGVMLDRIVSSLKMPSEVRPAVVALARACRSEEPAARPDLAEAIAALGGEPAPLVAPYVEPAVLVGRADAVARLERFLDGTAGAALLVAGEEGMGKSRLLEEARWLARDRFRVVDGDAAAPGGVAAMLRRALDDEELPNDPVAALDAVSRLTAPTLFVLDDVDRAAEADVALARALFRSADGQAIVVGSARRARGWKDVAEVHALEPLDVEAVAAWMAGRLPPEHAAEVHRLTGGSPGALVDLMRALGWRDWGVEDLRRLAEAGLDPGGLDALGAQERTGLAAVAATRLPATAATLASIGVSSSVVARLASLGWLVSDDAGWRLSRRGFAEAALSRVTDEERRRLHSALADALVTGTNEQRVEAARQAVLAGEPRALTWLSGDAAREHPDAWVNVAREVVARSDDPRWLVEAARVLERAGRSDEALSAIARARRRGAEAAPSWRLAAAAYLRSGRIELALRFARRAVRALEGEARAGALDLLSRIQLKRASWSEASQAAEEGLSLAKAEGVAEALLADLHDDLGVAASYRGDLDVAREHLAEAAERHRRAGRARAAARSASYRALADYRAGNTAEAAEGYREALRLAERCGAADLIVYAAQNLGVARHQLGDLGDAAASYERGLALAVALGDAATEATLRTNLAKLYGDLGLFERATAVAKQAEALAEAAGLGLIAATAMSVRGEVALWLEEAAAARTAFERARAAFGDQAAREVAETELHLVEAHRLAGDAAAAAEAAERAAARLEPLGPVEDLRARLALARARLALDRGALGEAIAGLEEAARAARAAGQRELEAECHAWSYRACRARGAAAMAEEHAATARRLWERTAVTLSAERADAYWRHPVRKMVPRAREEGAGMGGAQAERLRRLLDINKRLSSTLDPAAILPLAIDSALELTGAERGFVILAAEGNGELRVAATRNIDPDEGDDEARFSQSIAHQVIAGGEPVITVDAQSDARFVSQKSVHAMRLKSVVGVPIIAPAGVIGAFYLDHRFRRGIFGPEQVDLLEAFADQVAIALSNARLHQELAARTAALDALTRGQAERIDDLTERVKNQQQVLQTRYDYRNIIGTSPAMQTVFKVLDRVIASDVPVLVQGESGTGKELIAKAIHFNGERKEGKLVSINCGALPENLLESELFGYVRGAFTGASEDREGLFVAARGGTLFLDEVGEMPPSMQVKLLRAIQEREVTPLGTATPVPVDARLVAASNRRLREEAEAGRFREDLYYRLGVVEVWVPPLRERGGDIALLIQACLKDVAKKTGAREPRLSKRAMKALLDHAWPGNVRELENVITKAVLLAEGGVVDVGDLGLVAPPRQAPQTRGEHEQATAERLRDTLQATGWNVSETARRLGVSRPTVYRWMKRYGLDEG